MFSICNRAKDTRRIIGHRVSENHQEIGMRCIGSMAVIDKIGLQKMHMDTTVSELGPDFGRREILRLIEYQLLERIPDTDKIRNSRCQCHV